MNPATDPPAGGGHRTLAVLPGLPDQRTGGGVVLYELLAFLAGRGLVAAVVPMAAGREAELDRLRRDPGLAGPHGGVAWHPLREQRVPGLSGYAARATGLLPSDAAKVATEENRAELERVRRDFRPTVELAVSSWALAAYRGLAFAEGVRLFMVNVDPAIVWQAMPAVWSARGTLRAVVRKLACGIDRPKVRRLCRRAVATADRVGAIATSDIAALNALGGRSDVRHVPPLMRLRPVDRSRAEPGRVLITTNFTYSPNVESLRWFLGEVWPHVDRSARLTVAGMDDAGQLAAVCRAHDRVEYAGCLGPADLDEAFARTAVAVNPTRRGSGFQVKLLDAIARGVPVVSTAFSNRVGGAIPSSDDPRELAKLITARLQPGIAESFDYEAYYRDAVGAWERFLWGSIGG